MRLVLSHALLQTLEIAVTRACNVFKHLSTQVVEPRERPTVLEYHVYTLVNQVILDLVLGQQQF